MKVSDNFHAEEFISRADYAYLTGRGLNPKWYINSDVVNFCEWLKAHFNDAKVTINDWKWGGQYKESGLRTSYGSSFSQHKFQKAVDVKVEGYTPAEIREALVNNFAFISKAYNFSTMEKLEYTPTWNHCDFRETGLDYMLEVNGK
jgi:hypothetical protein